MVPAGRARAGRHEHRAGRLRRRGDRPHRARARARRPGVPPRRPERAARRATCSTRSRSAAARAAAARCASTRRLLDALPKGTVVDADAAARRSSACADAILARLRHPGRGRRPRRLHRAVRHRATPSARWTAAGIEVPPSWRPTRDELWDYWERNLDPDLFKRPLARGRRQRQDGRSSPAPRSGIGRAAALQDRARRRHPAARRARRRTSSRRRATRSSSAGGTRLRLPGRPLRPGVDRRARRRRCSPSTRAIDMLVNNAGRSIRRSIALSLRPLPRLRAHDAAQLLRRDQADHGRCCRTCASAGSGHIVNVSSIGVQTNPPRFSRLRRVEGGARRLDARRQLRDRSATASPSRRSTCRSCARR